MLRKRRESERPFTEFDSEALHWVAMVNRHLEIIREGNDRLTVATGTERFGERIVEDQGVKRAQIGTERQAEKSARKFFSVHRANKGQSAAMQFEQS